MHSGNALNNRHPQPGTRSTTTRAVHARERLFEPFHFVHWNPRSPIKYAQHAFAGGGVAKGLNQDIAAAVARPYVLQGDTFHISVSTGTALSDGDAPAEELLRRADAAMYVDKRARRVPRVPR